MAFKRVLVLLQQLLVKKMRVLFNSMELALLSFFNI